ncbi:MAG TPA: hypothetical protein VND40_04785 [Nitrososphaerales archaeon]|nr:hypothetical protein [Nitrososphaerales archaeon]
MKRTGEGMRQNNGINQIIEFIRENALALEIGSNPVITSKGERFLQILSETATRSNSGLSGVL